MSTARLISLPLLLLGLGCGARGPLKAPPTFPMALGWLVELEGRVLVPLASDGERVFVSTRDGAVQAFAPDTGELLWRAEEPTGRLVARAGLLIVRGEDGKLWRLDPVSGNVLWARQSGIPGSHPPVLDGEQLLVAGRGIAALDAESGRPLWGDTESGEQAAPPTSWGRWTLSAEGGGLLRCRDRASGQVSWERELGAPLLATPRIDDRQRVLLGINRRLMALHLGKDGRKRWHWTTGTDMAVSPTLLGEDKVLFATLENVLYAFKRGNGHLVWRLPLPSRPLAAPQLITRPLRRPVEGGPPERIEGEHVTTILMPCHEKELLGVNAETGKRAGVLRTPTPMWTPPLVIGERLFVALRTPWALASFSLASLVERERKAEEEAKAAAEAEAAANEEAASDESGESPADPSAAPPEPRPGADEVDPEPPPP